jgi:hypothetical protein
MWMGGWAPLGYDIRNRKLVNNPSEAELVHSIFYRFARYASGTKLVQELAKEGARNKQGKAIDKGHLYRLLSNRVYLGEAVHKGTAYPGEHQPIIDLKLWALVHESLRESPRKRAARTRARTPALLKGLIFGPTGCAMTPTHTRRRGRLYRYYVSTTVIRTAGSACPIRRIPAGEIEAAVVNQIGNLVQTPKVVVAAWKAARKHSPRISETTVRESLRRFPELWSELFPAEQARITQLLVDRIDISETGADITLRTDGIDTLAKDFGSVAALSTEAA